MQKIIPTILATCNTCGSGDAVLVGKSWDWEFKTCENVFEYVQCTQCEQVYLKNRPDISQLSVIYPPEYSSYHYNENDLGSLIARIRSYVQSLKINVFKKYAPLGATVVDVGCGNGELLRVIKAHGQKNWKLVGVDLSQETVSILKKSDIECRVGRFEEMDWVGPAPHVIIMNQVIEHLEDPKKAAKKALDILAPGGVFIMETPSVKSWDAQLFRKRYWGGWHTPRHWYIYSPQTINKMLKEVGFEEVKINFILNPYAWLMSLQFFALDRLKMPKLSKFFQVSVFPALVFVSLIDVLQKLLTAKTSNMQVIARKKNEG